MGKKVVIYADYMPITLGERARVMAVDHPSFVRPGWVHTSEVVILCPHDGRNPVFETANTRYEPGAWRPQDPNNYQRLLA